VAEQPDSCEILESVLKVKNSLLIIYTSKLSFQISQDVPASVKHSIIVFFSLFQPMLWSVIFKYHLELEHHNEAYAAIVHNPDKTRRENCLRHFIITLCDRGLFHEICTYPYVNLQEEVYITLWANWQKKTV